MQFPVRALFDDQLCGGSLGHDFFPTAVTADDFGVTHAALPVVCVVRLAVAPARC